VISFSEFATAKGFALEQLERYGVRQGARGVEIPYFTPDGAEYERLRIRTALAAKDGSKWSQGEAKLIPYGLQRPISFDKNYVFIVEGETDCWALWNAGKPAIGIPGAQATKCLRIDYVDGANTIYVIREPGEAGSRFPHLVATQLYDCGYSGEVYAVELGDAKDPHDLWRSDPSNFEAKLRATLTNRTLMVKPEPAMGERPAANVRPLSELMTRPRRKREWLIDGMLTKGGIMLVAGKPKAGKSVLARNIMRSIVSGQDFLGNPVMAGKVVWLRLEEQYEDFIEGIESMGLFEYADRIITNEDIPQDDLVGWLEQIVAEHEPSLVIVDTWAKLTRVQDINNYSMVNQANEPLMRLRDLGIAQIWLHHAKKGDSDDVLGSQALFAACDTLLTYKRASNDLRSVWTTQRIGNDMPETVVAMDPQTFRLEIAGTRDQIRTGVCEADVLSYLADRPEGRANKVEITDSVPRRRIDVLAAIESLRERGLVAVDSDVDDGVPHWVQLLLKRPTRRLVAVSNQQAQSAFGNTPRNTRNTPPSETQETLSLRAVPGVPGFLSPYIHLSENQGAVPAVPAVPAIPGVPESRARTRYSQTKMHIDHFGSNKLLDTSLLDTSIYILAARTSGRAQAYTSTHTHACAYTCIDALARDPDFEVERKLEPRRHLFRRNASCGLLDARSCARRTKRDAWRTKRGAWRTKRRAGSARGMPPGFGGGEPERALRGLESRWRPA